MKQFSSSRFTNQPIALQLLHCNCNLIGGLAAVNYQTVWLNAGHQHQIKTAIFLTRKWVKCVTFSSVQVLLTYFNAIHDNLISISPGSKKYLIVQKQFHSPNWPIRSLISSMEFISEHWERFQFYSLRPRMNLRTLLIEINLCIFTVWSSSTLLVIKRLRELLAQVCF